MRVHVTRACDVKSLDSNGTLESLRCIKSRVDYLENELQTVRFAVSELINTFQDKSGYESIVSRLRSILLTLPTQDSSIPAHTSNVEQFIRGNLDYSKVQGRRVKTKALRDKN